MGEHNHPLMDHPHQNSPIRVNVWGWKINHPTIPHWAKAARIVFAFTSSSAASERVFSLVDSMFGSERKSSLADQLQGSVMLKYNKRQIG